MWRKFKAKVEDYVIWIFLAVPLGGFIISYIRTISHNNSTVMDITYGILSTLIGAFIGGFCSLAAAIYAGDQQIKTTIRHDSRVKMKDTYYLPIYLELIEIEEQLLTRDGWCEQLMCAEWERIRKAATVLEIPQSIIKPLNNMYKTYSEHHKEPLDDEYRTAYLKDLQTAKIALEKIIKNINKA